MHSSGKILYGAFASLVCTVRAVVDCSYSILHLCLLRSWIHQERETSGIIVLPSSALFTRRACTKRKGRIGSLRLVKARMQRGRCLGWMGLTVDAVYHVYEGNIVFHSEANSCDIISRQLKMTEDCSLSHPPLLYQSFFLVRMGYGVVVE